ncbi:MAG: response regulator transcription factor [Anaerolineaceae bacterium]|jgi:DNA-binding NarL/FixJ family response regulator|nr:response regulator transcription factor [Anaerolineaceae bacterium]
MNELSPKLRILLAEDHLVVREGLKMLINSQPDLEVIAEAGDGQAAVDYACQLHPDLVVMDVTMPRLNGVAATQKLKKERPDIKVLALTVHEDRGYVAALLEAGVSGYVLKRAAAHELITAIYTAAGGGVYLDNSMADKIIMDYGRNQTRKGSSLKTELSERESEVIRMIAFGYSNKEIALQLNLSIKTVETYKTRAMEKLELHSRADIVRYAMQCGWLKDV